MHADGVVQVHHRVDARQPTVAQRTLAQGFGGAGGALRLGAEAAERLGPGCQVRLGPVRFATRQRLAGALYGAVGDFRTNDRRRLDGEAQGAETGGEGGHLGGNDGEDRGVLGHGRLQGSVRWRGRGA